MEAAFTLAFILPGFSPSVTPPPGGASPTEMDVDLILTAVNETSFPLVGTLPLTVLNPAPSSTIPVATDNQAEVNTTFLSMSPPQGQSLFTQLNIDEVGTDDQPLQTEPETPGGQASSAPPWLRSVLALDDLFLEVRHENEDAGPTKDAGKPAEDDEAPMHDRDDPFGYSSPGTPANQPTEPTPAQTRRPHQPGSHR